MLRRVVVTGMGVVTPLGNDLNTLWKNLIESRSGIAKITKEFFENPDEFKVKIAGVCSLPNDLNQGKIKKHHFMAFSASKSALEDGNWFPTSDGEKERTGVFVGGNKFSGEAIFANQKFSDKERFKFIGSELYDLIDSSSTISTISKNYDFRGPNSGYISACAAGQCSIAEGFNSIVDGDADIVLAGGNGISLNSYVVNGFNRLGALAKNFSDNPELASQPFDEKREGFVVADGCGILLIEELDHALKRGAKIYAELKSVSSIGEGFHATRPKVDGEGISRSMQQALKRAGVRPEDIDLIHCHGTSTPEGDKAEVHAMTKLFPSPGPSIMGIKGNIGHSLTGVGGIQAVTTVLAIKNSTIPPILNLKNPISVEGRTLDYVKGEPRQKEINLALTNNAGFGGFNCSLLFSKYS
jgi:3-oxoacyl-[acyl-carrier-protein] synthase II